MIADAARPFADASMAPVNLVSVVTWVAVAVVATDFLGLGVLRLLARWYAYKEIAKELYISIKTVETHVSSVLRKLQLSNRYELSRWANDRRL